MPYSIGVIIPAYNAAGFITAALDSVASQTRRPEQIIVVDDGSRDGTADVVRQWIARTGHAVDLVVQPNGGVSRARNLAFERCRTDLIALLDADDLLLPNHLATLEKAFLQRADLVLAFGKTRVISATQETLRFFPDGRVGEVTIGYGANDLHILGGAIYESLIPGSYIGVSATLLSRDAALAIGGMDPALPSSEDQDFFIRLSRTGTFVYIPVVVSAKRSHDNNSTHPRHALTVGLVKLRLYEKMMRQATLLGLTEREIAATREALGRLSPEILYPASLRGFLTFFSTWRELCLRGQRYFIAPPRDVARAIYYTFRRAEGL